VSESAERYRKVRSRDWRSCDRKVRYDTFDQADRYRRRAEGDRPQGLRVYDCELCGGWHLTKRSKGGTVT